ncbi:uncharacterized protein BYT42DRAFT_360193 [Radiomyces spectabilis]|uniref:uncharacterized protein n=1 Tax=Radiomyces spectabilis TaxID=64574 RepID=UPI0022210E4B|nr:uncharacterized protein BYT42DRAFT_360193 [Radiomyces spectabilis]KAI8377868.1 hypothetical protein BYT42DRAFT_360193 [Radiomyces spectabilis]
MPERILLEMKTKLFGRQNKVRTVARFLILKAFVSKQFALHPKSVPWFRILSLRHNKRHRNIVRIIQLGFFDGSRVYSRQETPQRCTYGCSESSVVKPIDNLATHSCSSETVKEYSCNSLIQNLKVFFQRPGFEQKVNQWRTRNVQTSECLSDVYDGAMTSIPDPNDASPPFVAHERTLLLTSIQDVIYKIANNSPTIICHAMNDSRRKTSSLLVLCLVFEPSTDVINSYLQPLVNELKKLYTDMPTKTYRSPETVVRAALLMSACDISAARKWMDSQRNQYPCLLQVQQVVSSHFRRL